MPDEQEGKNHEPESESGFMRLMEERHRAAMTALEIEDVVLSTAPFQQDEYPTTRTDHSRELKAALDAKLSPLVETLVKEGRLAKAESVRDLSRKFLLRAVSTEREEYEAMQILELDGIERTSETMGAYFFKKIMKRAPIGKVVMWSMDGCIFIRPESKEDHVGNLLSGGHYREIDGAPVIVIEPGQQSISSIRAHERQHFINHSVFSRFAGDIEDSSGSSVDAMSPESKEAMRAVKDEVLARMRETESPENTGVFFDTPLYEYLREPFLEGNSADNTFELGRVQALLEQIQKELVATRDI